MILLLINLLPITCLLIGAHSSVIDVRGEMGEPIDIKTKLKELSDLSPAALLEVLEEMNEKINRLEKQSLQTDNKNMTDRKRRHVADTSNSPPDSDFDTQYTPYISGHMCPPGPTGPPGPSGVQGLPGRDGINGRDGRELTYTELKGDTGTISDVPDPSRSNASLGGSTFVRWGGNNCPDTADMVYEGVIGGPLYTDKGSGGNYLCLPLDPIYGATEASVTAQRARIYGAELYGTTFPPFNNVHNTKDDLTCVVCRSSARATVLMIPAKNVCPTEDWVLEYSGYLAAAHLNSNYRTEYICVDGNPQGASRTSGEQVGTDLVAVEGICVAGGGLPCGPYVNGYELTCAVCTM